MSLNEEALQMIELDAARAPTPMLEHYIDVVRAGRAESTQEVAEHADALLLKLEHLARTQRAEAPEPHDAQAYLAPWITPAEPVREAA